MSPLGDGLKNCIWNFPSIISCTTIDLFKDWPAEALQAVAQRHMQDMGIEIQT